MENVKVIALEIMKRACENDDIGEEPDLDLFEAGLIDSLASVMIILEIEEQCGIRLQPTDLKKENITSVNSFINFLENLVS